MITITMENLQQIIPVAAAWVAAKEQVAMENGNPLTAIQITDAIAAGVQYPERIRLFVVAQIPFPKHPILKAAMDLARLISEHTLGIAFRYGIFIRRDRLADRSLLIHEMVHTAQYERVGGIPAYLEQYLTECLTYGIADAPLEKAAVEASGRLCQPLPEPETL